MKNSPTAFAMFADWHANSNTETFAANDFFNRAWRVPVVDLSQVNATELPRMRSRGVA